MMKKYALVSGKHVRYADLRETPKFLMSDCHAKYKFKKTGDRDYIATNSGFSNWSRTGYDVYEVDHPCVLKLIQDEKQSYYIFKVRQELEKLHKERGMSFEDAKKINELLEFGVEL